MAGLNVSKTVLSSLDDISLKKTFLVISKPENYHEASFSVLKHLSSFKKKGIYITLNNPCKAIISSLKENNIDSGLFFFIDCVSKQVDKRISSNENALFTEGHSLTEISIALTSALDTGDYSFVCFESLTTLLIYNNPEAVEDFIHYLISKAKNHGISEIILSIDEEKSNKVSGIISQFCDKVIKV